MAERGAHERLTPSTHRNLTGAGHPGDAGGRRPSAWRCRLAPGVRLRRRSGRGYVVCERPLAVLEVRPAALRLLGRLPPGRDVVLPALRPAELRLLRHLADAGLADLRPVAGELPAVTVVVPVRGRPRELAACLASLAAQRYPQELLEVVVVDDGSAPPAAVPPGVRLVRLDRPGGPAAARNAGARAASAGALAFLDSDCVADPGWLAALVPELADPEVAAAGGRVGPMARDTWLERYEAVRSPLDLGARRAAARPGRPVAYLVTASLVVRRADLEAAGGFDAGMRFGEDVDLCWRLHAAGRRLVYQPEALVRHRHRGSPRAFAATRAAYAGSEVALLARHPGARRWLALSPGAAALVLGGVGALLGRRRLLAAGVLALAVETAATAARLRPLGMSRRRVVPALLRGQAAGLYWAARQIIRYYSVPVLVAALSSGPARRRLLVAWAGLLAVPAAADWWRLRPRLGLLAFVAAHALDDAAYQIGLLRSCLRARTLDPLRVTLRLTGRRGIG
jgi:mycofactocin glycosyltransferase